MDDQLFSVFEEQPGDSSSEAEGESELETKSRDRSKKRKIDGAIKNNGEANGDDGTSAVSSPGENHTEAVSDSEQDHKRRKKEGAVEPVLTDNFQTAESRELAPAGFTPEKDATSIVLSHNIQHQVALPPDLNYDYVPLSEHKSPDEPARTWDFKLDPFQSLSVASIERDESVLVSAHTSAGKTVVAEYAIAQCLKRNQRVIYTSPIKALSNQKYRDFESIFGDVGLMTGDVTINPTASCLVMTTEILRSMLYRGSEIMREVAWVVFDEIHYMRDKVRGVVWEETIILLPDKVRYVFLSATIPNAFQFAEWIAKIHHQACHVVYTDFRPTPLQNYFYPTGSKGLYLVVDEKGVFKEQNFRSAMLEVQEFREANPKETGSGKNKKKTPKKDNDERKPIARVIMNIMKRNYQPVIVFSFSKRECENMAMDISSLRFTDDSEKEVVRTIFTNAIESLPEESRQIPQIANILPLLERGIGVHHSGLLPILKETIEILFQESLIKVLFATETFSIGLNMPAKTVVFTQVKKFDGTQNRPLTSSEYIQMAGRAGRRGLDTRGIVIMMVDDNIEPEVFKNIVVGHQDRLNSAFHLGYNMILNLLRIEAVSPEFMLERCFFQFQTSASVPMLEKELTELQLGRDSMAIADEATIKDYYNTRRQLHVHHRDMRATIQQPRHCQPFLQPGRLVQVYNPKVDTDDVSDGLDFGWGVVVNTMKRKVDNMTNDFPFPVQESMIVEVFLAVSPDSGRIMPAGDGQVTGDLPEGVKPETSNRGTRFEVVPCLFTCIKSISQIRVFMPKSGLEADRDKQQLMKSLFEITRRFPDGFPILDPIENMDIKDEGFKKLLRKIEVLESHLLSNPLHGASVLPELWAQYHTKVKMGDSVKEKKKAIAKAHSIAQLDELKSYKRVLRRLGFINDQEVVQLKARVACEISCTEGHELLLAELLFDRFFNELTPEVCAAVLSCFIFDEKEEADPLKEHLAKPYREVQAKAKLIARISRESKVEINEEEYVKSLKWSLMETVHAWASGAKFIDIAKMTLVYEGSLIRLFRRLEELLRQMAQAAKVMGSTDLAQKFEDALNKIRRDIITAQSLYL